MNRIGSVLHHDSLMVSSIQGIQDRTIPYVLDASFLYENEKIIIHNLVVNHHLSLFLRCSDQHNMARGDNVPGDILLGQLMDAQAMGFKGMIVSTGRSSILNVSRALDYLRREIMRLLQETTPLCPLLLHTCEVKTTELLTCVEDLIDFVVSFGDTRLGIALYSEHANRIPINIQVVRLIMAKDTDTEADLQCYLSYGIPICIR